MSDLYAPNQQVVRADGSGPAEEGAGGSGGAPSEPEPKSLDAMTKDELLAYASSLGVATDSSMTKAEIRAAIDAGPAPTTSQETSS